ncbi:MAG: TetR/AcrR family transcriptional regulator [Oscillospiraceae bacterium]|nr:TetR/AcrR family transcriptional regulator [Oscillospiraceae bacterium]
MDRRVLKTRSAIRNAYVSLLMEKKSMKMTVTELAKKANIDRKTFYLHYETTDDVMRDYNKQLIQNLLVLLEKQDFFNQNFNTVSLYSALNRIISDNLEFFRHIARMDYYDSFWEQSKEALTVGICNMYKEKVLVSEDVMKLYSRFVLSGTLEIYREWLKGNLSFSLEELGRFTSEVSFRGFAPALKSGHENHSETEGELQHELQNDNF